MSFLATSSIPYAAIASFAVVTSGTPGPNNLWLAQSGLAFGFRRTLPALLGIYLGCCLLFVICGFGVAPILVELPWLHRALGLAGAAYLAWLGMGMIKSSWATADAQRPVRCGSAAVLQLANPKLWWMCAFALVQFAPAGEPGATAVVAAFFMACTLPCLASYVLLGSLVTRIAQSAFLRRTINLLLASATLATAALLAWRA